MDQQPKTTGDTGAEKTEITTNTSTDQETAQVETVDCQPKKSHLGAIIIGIIVAVIVVLLGALTAWYFLLYNQSDKAAFDAMHQLLRADAVVAKGDLVVWSDSSNGPLERLTLSLDSASQALPNSVEATLKVNFSDGNEIAVKLGTVQMADGVIYVQLSGLVDSLRQLELDEVTENGITEIINSLEVIDNEWWQISVPDILDSLELGTEETKGLKELYGCVVDTMRKSKTDDLATLYQQHQFVSAQSVEHTLPKDHDRTHYPASWHHLYEVTINKNKLARFVNGIPETATATEFYNCYNSVMAKYSDEEGLSESISSADFEEISASDLDFLDDVRLFMEVSDFGHQLTGVYLYYNVDGIQASGAFDLTYQPVTVSAPEDYRPITELIDEFIELIAGGLEE